MARPFIKCVGGKSQLLPEIQKRIPDSFDRYLEPFLGGGAVFFYLQEQGRLSGKDVYLSDANGRLIQEYENVQNSCSAVIQSLRNHKLSDCEDHFYTVRGRIEWRPGDYIYINKAGFNGLYRENKAGKCNTPWGHRDFPFGGETERALWACSNALKYTLIRRQSFTEIFPFPNDFIYLDPPYFPVSKTANFTSYTKDGFSIDDQKKLAELVKYWVGNVGCKVLLSNADVPEIYDLYKGLQIEKVQARRNVSCNGTGRGKVGEVLIRGGY